MKQKYWKVYACAESHSLVNHGSLHSFCCLVSAAAWNEVLLLPTITSLTKMTDTQSHIASKYAQVENKNFMSV